MLNRIVDIFRKSKVLRLAKKSGCDVDGDLVTYKGTMYYVDLFHGVIKRI